MKVSGLKIKLMAEGNMFTQMDQPMKVIGQIMNNTEWEEKKIFLGLFMKDNLYIIKSKASVL